MTRWTFRLAAVLSATVLALPTSGAAGPGGLGGGLGMGHGGPIGGMGGGLGGGMGGGGGGPMGGGLGGGLGPGSLGSIDHGDFGGSRGLDDAAGRSIDRLDDRGRGLAHDVDRETRSDVRKAVDDAQSTAENVRILTDARREAAQALIRAHPDVVEPDALGEPVVRGEVLAIAPSPGAIARAEKIGFRVRGRDALPELGISNVVLQAPRRMPAPEALRRLRALDPQGLYDLDHLYQESGLLGTRRAPAPAPSSPAAPSGIRIGLVDGGVAEHQPALAGAHLIQQGFAGAGPKPSAHGTAVASLLAGREGRFRGAAPGATVYVADVYGGAPAGGSAQAIAHAFAWLAQARVPVINISLVGPPNLLLEAAVKALIARGHVLVAAVGNDGPAAPPLYPASYPGVVAVTAVDSRRRLLPEAGRAAHVDFAAPGSDMAAAGPDGGFVSVRGTSFAAPIAAGLLAQFIETPAPANAERAVSALAHKARDLGPRGPDALFGRGLVGAELRTPPSDVRAVMALRGP